MSTSIRRLRIVRWCIYSSGMRQDTVAVKDMIGGDPERYMDVERLDLAIHRQVDRVVTGVQRSPRDTMIFVADDQTDFFRIGDGVIGLGSGRNLDRIASVALRFETQQRVRSEFGVAPG